MNINREIVYENGKVISTTTKVEEMDKATLFRLLESCTFEQQMILTDVSRMREKYNALKKNEEELKEALEVIEKADAKKADAMEDALDSFEE